ncbi:unnamed protein product, partial [Ixodes pacificus]
CVRCIIQEQLKKVQDTLNDIDSLDTAVNTVVSRLSTLRSSRLSLALEPDGGHLPQPMGIRDEEEELLTQQIENLQKEKWVPFQSAPVSLHVVYTRLGRYRRATYVVYTRVTEFSWDAAFGSARRTLVKTLPSNIGCPHFLGTIRSALP